MKFIQINEKHYAVEDPKVGTFVLMEDPDGVVLFTHGNDTETCDDWHHGLLCFLSAFSTALCADALRSSITSSGLTQNQVEDFINNHQMAIGEIEPVRRL